MSNVPCKNPLKYCRLCLSEDNELVVLESHESLTTPMSLLLQKLFHYMKITFHKDQDYPSAICNGCRNRLNGFHDYRRMVVRNHNAVKTFRRLFGDQIEEEQPTLIEVFEDDSQLMEIKQEFEAEEAQLVEQHQQQQQIKTEHGRDSGKETVKEVDVYHLDGELRTVVVKEEQLSPVKEEKLSPVKPALQVQKSPEPKRSLPVAKTSPNIINSKITILKRPQGRLLNMEHAEKRAKVIVGSEFAVVKCSQCRAVFRNRENLLIHERDDHSHGPQPKSIPKKIVTPPSTANQARRISRPQTPQTLAQLFKCTHCSSSFIHKGNYEQHLKTCKAATLSQLNSQIVVKRTTPAVMNEVIKAAVAKVGRQVQIKPVEKVIEIKQEDSDEERIRCQYCPLTYKTKYYLKKHLFDIHKIDEYEDVYYCHVCKLNYSCDEDLQLHNRALHRFQCKQCPEDFRTCMHAQTNDGRPAGENGIVNKRLFYTWNGLRAELRGDGRRTISRIQQIL